MLNQWSQNTYGEIHHLKMAPPFIRLAHKIETPKGDFVSLYDLRCRKPSFEKLEPRVLHSVEHILIEGFRHFAPKEFVNAAPMGCQTGFYIILIGLLQPHQMNVLLEKILERALTLEEVPYRKESDCGQPVFHDLEDAKTLIKELLSKKSSWSEIIKD